MEYMSPQEQEIVNYFNEYMRQSQTTEGKGPGSSSSIMLPPPPSSPVKNAIETVINENHIVRRPATIHCNLLATKLQVLKELRVDFNNLAANGMDLRPALLFQGWENYFARLLGPVYDLLVKEFWRHAENDNHYVVSHVLGKKNIITEKTIAQLLGLKHKEGIRISGKEKNISEMLKNSLNHALYTEKAIEDSEYTVKTLQPELRIWHRIILGCINPRFSTNSADYINNHQKFMLYCLKKNKKICLPHILFQFLKDAVFNSRTSSGKKKVSTNIPFGRLISDILEASRLVDSLREASITEDLAANVGAILDAKNLKNMEVIKDIDVPPTPESAHDALMQQFLIDGFPLFSEIEPPNFIAYYIYRMEQDGVDISGLDFAEIPLAPADDNYKGPRLRKRRQLTEDIEKETKKLKKEAK